MLAAEGGVVAASPQPLRVRVCMKEFPHPLPRNSSKRASEQADILGAVGGMFKGITHRDFCLRKLSGSELRLPQRLPPPQTRPELALQCSPARANQQKHGKMLKAPATAKHVYS